MTDIWLLQVDDAPLAKYRKEYSHQTVQNTMKAAGNIKTIDSDESPPFMVNVKPSMKPRSSDSSDSDDGPLVRCITEPVQTRTREEYFRRLQ